MNRITIGSALMSVTIVATSAGQPAPAVPQSAAHNEVVIRNAVVMTVTHGNIQNGSVYIKDGKIAAVGKDVSTPPGATVIDAGGKYLTPGIIDSHSHIALDDDVNEATSPVTPQMMMIDAFDYRSEEHTSELQSQSNLVCRLLLEKKKKQEKIMHDYIF